MGYVMYVDGDLTTSRELTKDEQEMILEEYDFNEPIDIDEDEIYLYTEYEGLCPDEYLSDDVNTLIKIGKEIGFTISGELTLDMTMGCCGRQRWKIDNSEIEVVESESDFLEDYTDQRLIDELKRRGYKVTR